MCYKSVSEKICSTGVFPLSPPRCSLEALFFLPYSVRVLEKAFARVVFKSLLLVTSGIERTVA